MTQNRTADANITPFTIRPATFEDNRAAFDVFQNAVLDLGDRLGVETISGGHEPDAQDALWQRRKPLMQHLTRTAESFWVAEAGGQVIGYARTLQRDDVRQLSDFFVRPGHQSAGVGRALLEAALPADRPGKRVIIATPDTRAQVRYLKSGVYPRFPVHYFYKQAQSLSYETELNFVPMQTDQEHIEALNQIDRDVIGYARPVDHLWLMRNRQGFVYKRANTAVGYGYVGSSSGPFALLDAGDYPAVLAHAETLIATQNGKFGVEVPLINQRAVDYVLAHGFRMEAFYCNFMTSEPFGHYENYLVTSPSFFS